MRTNTDQIAQFLEHTCSMHTIHVYKYRSNSTFGKLIYCTFLTRLQHWSWRREDGDFSFCSLRNWDTISIVSKDSVTSACPVLLSNTCNVEVYHHRRRQYCIYSGEKMFLLLFCFFKFWNLPLPPPSKNNLDHLVSTSTHPPVWKIAINILCNHIYKLKHI